mmetsp:Transcript_49009/g.93651  ORF Transcript_49009/g.93651 Transcript_49009/m.93651 type:complete len:245 (-) Transcript_49009:1614-2348(-)
MATRMQNPAATTVESTQKRNGRANAACASMIQMKAVPCWAGKEERDTSPQGSAICHAMKRSNSSREMHGHQRTVQWNCTIRGRDSISARMKATMVCASKAVRCSVSHPAEARAATHQVTIAKPTRPVDTSTRLRTCCSARSWWYSNRGFLNVSRSVSLGSSKSTSFTASILNPFFFAKHMDFEVGSVSDAGRRHQRVAASILGFIQPARMFAKENEVVRKMPRSESFNIREGRSSSSDMRFLAS